ncbi:mannosyltransferase [Balamuthia mandrillaris]
MRRRKQVEGPSALPQHPPGVAGPGSAANNYHHISSSSKDIGEHPTYSPGTEVVLSPATAFMVFLVARLLSAFFNTIPDCDEVYNYWEPSHYLTFGFGFQTWEYSPTFALRPYLYVAFHAALGHLLTLFGIANKVVVFYLIRCGLAAFCSFGEATFYRGVVHAFGPRVGLLTLLFLLSSCGMWIASTAHLPNSFSMYGVLLCFGWWFQRRHTLAVFAGALAVLLGWPFVALLFVPVGIDLLWQCGPVRVLLWGTAALLTFILPSIFTDWYYYGFPVVAVWNLIRYNVLDSNTGSHLYGVEPWTYYISNAFLNFNFVFFLSLLSFPCLLTFRKWSSHLQHLGRRPLFSVCCLAPLYLWLAVMLRMAHKEERFLFVIYPLICFAAAVTLVVCLDVTKVILGALSPTGWKISVLRKLLFIVGTTFVLVVATLAFSRTAGLTIHYGAPMQLYGHLSAVELQHGKNSSHPVPGQVNICVGKEWYRFPSSYFLPSSKYQLAFLRSSFRGQLPQPYATGENGTRVIPANMNDQNQEEPSRYIEIEKCHYLVDLEFEGQTEPFYSEEEGWTVVADFPFLDTARSHPFFRAFYIPFLSPRYTAWSHYYLLRNARLVALYTR